MYHPLRFRTSRQYIQGYKASIASLLGSLGKYATVALLRSALDPALSLTLLTEGSGRGLRRDIDSFQDAAIYAYRRW